MGQFCRFSIRQPSTDNRQPSTDNGLKEPLPNTLGVPDGTPKLPTSAKAQPSLCRSPVTDKKTAPLESGAVCKGLRKRGIDYSSFSSSWYAFSSFS